MTILLWILKRFLGVVLIVYGLFALVTPFTPGSWLALFGLELLGAAWLLPKPVRVRWDKAKGKLKAKFRK